jgi:hypothetical protein
MAAVAAYFYTNVIKSPYDIPEDRISVDFLLSKAELGKYKLITNAAENPIRNGDEEVVAYYSIDGEVTENETENYVGISKGQDRLDDVLKNIQGSECTPRTQRNGTENGITYYRGVCGRSNYFIYARGDKWIMFDAEDGADNLDIMIKEYLK